MARSSNWLIALLLAGLFSGCEGNSEHFVGKSSIELGYLDRLKAINPRAVGYFPNGQIKEIKFLETKISETALIAIGAASTIEILLLGQSDITDDGLRHLVGLDSLRTLGVMRTAVTDAGMRHIREFRGLETLVIGHTAVTDAGLAYLAGHETLQKLAMTNLAVTDAAVEHLVKIERLDTIEISGTEITEQGVARLKETFPDLKVYRGFDQKLQDARMEAVPSDD